MSKPKPTEPSPFPPNSPPQPCEPAPSKPTQIDAAQVRINLDYIFENGIEWPLRVA